MRLPYERPRVGQVEALKSLLDSLRKGVRRLALQAFTGFGKTAIAIALGLECLREGLVDRVVYCVRTRNELDPVIKELRRFGVDDFAVLYSARRMCPLASDGGGDPHGFWVTCSLLRQLGKCPYYKRVARELGGVSEVLAACSSHVEVARAIADKLGACPFFSMLELARTSRFIVCTYPYVFKERVWRSVLRDLVADHRVLLVVDEAHNLVGFGSLMGEEIGVEVLERALRELEGLGLGDSEAATIARGLLELGRGGGSRGWARASGVPKPGEEVVKLVADAVVELRMRLSLEPEEAMRARIALPALANFLEAASRSGFEIFVDRSEGRVGAMPTDPRVLEEALSRFDRVLAMSGTLYPKPVRKVVGVEGVEYLDVEELGAQNPLVARVAWCVATFVTSRYSARGDAMFRGYASIIELVRRFASSISGAALFVYPSYDFMKRVLSAARVGDECVAIEDRHTTLEAVERMVKACSFSEIHAVAGGKVTEGIEVVERGSSLIKLVAVMGVPYPQPDDYLEAIASSFASMGVDRFELFDCLATIRVLQSVGRCVRSENDWAIAILADSRFLRPSLRRGLRMARASVARSLVELETFLRHALITIQSLA